MRGVDRSRGSVDEALGRLERGGEEEEGDKEERGG